MLNLTLDLLGAGKSTGYLDWRLDVVLDRLDARAHDGRALVLVPHVHGLFRLRSSVFRSEFVFFLSRRQMTAARAAPASTSIDDVALTGCHIDARSFSFNL